MKEIHNNRFIVHDIWINLSPLNINIPDRMYTSDKAYIEVSDYISKISTYLYQSKNSMISLF